MYNYHNMLRNIISMGQRKTNRTGIDTIAIFGYQFRHDLKTGFPLLTTKRIFTKAVVHEMLWFLSGSSNIGYLNENGVTIWDEWADEHGELGPVYGTQWRSWGGSIEDPGGIDQIQKVIDSLKMDPFSRRHIVTAWNPSEVEDAALPPCHCFFQFHVSAHYELSCHMYMRSADAFLGVPFNIASYALLTHMVAHVTGLDVKDLVISFGDLHIYNNHMNQVQELLSREPRPLPRLELNKDVFLVDQFKYDDIKVVEYDPWPAIKAEVAV